MNDQAIRFRLGIFTLASLIVLAVLLTLFGGFPRYFRPAALYTIVFENAQGATAGTPVQRSGVRIGEVRSVKLDNPTGKVYVSVQIDESYTLRRGDRPTLVHGFLGGDTVIAFLPPDDMRKFDPTPVEPGETLIGFIQADASLVLQRAADIVVPAQDMLIEMRKVLQRLDTMAPIFEDAMRDIRELAKSGRSLPDEFGKTNREISALSKSMREFMPELQKTNEEIRGFVRLARDTVPELKRTNEEIQITARNFGRVGERADVLLQTNEAKITKTIEQLAEATRQVNELLSDDNQKNVREILRNTRVGSERFDSIARGTEDLIKDTRNFMRQINETLLRADETLLSIQKTTRVLGDRTPPIMKNLEESTDKVNRTLTDVRDLMQVLVRNEGTVQKLLTDPALYNNLNDTALMVSRLVPRLDHILRDIEIFADRIARHPEALGIGGAVRPSSGIK